MHRSRGFATLALLVVVGCGSGAQTDRVGNKPDPTIVTVGTQEPPASVAAMALGQLADEVERRSDGAVQIEVSYDVAGGVAAWDQQAIDRSADGAFDLVMARAGAWHSRGVTTLDVLQLPGLVDTDVQADRLVTDAALTERLLSGLGTAGFIGLGLFAEAPRYLMHLDGTRAFGPDALRGRTIRSPLSETAFAVLRAAGMLPVDLSAADFVTAVSNGDVTSTEGQLARVELTTTAAGTSNATVGVDLPLYTKFLVLAARSGALEDGTLDVLRDAVAAIGPMFAASRMTEADALAAACSAGGDLVSVPVDDRAAFMSAVQPVIDAFEEEENGDLLPAVRAAAGPPGPTANTCPTTSPTASADTPVGLPLELPDRRADIVPTPGDLPDGIYRFVETDEALAAAGAPSTDEPFVGEWVLRGGRAELRYFDLDGTPMVGQPADTGGVYQADGDLVIFATPPDRAMPGTSGIYLLRWSFEGDTLTLTQIDDGRRDADFLVPWVRVGDAPDP